MPENVGPHLLGWKPRPGGPDPRNYPMSAALAGGNELDLALAALLKSSEGTATKNWAKLVTKALDALNPTPAPTPTPTPTPSPTSKLWDNPHAILDQGNTPHCHPGDTLIRMTDGSWKRIDEVHLLDEVLTAEGNAGTVLETKVHFHAGDIFHIKLRGHTAGLRMTDEHPILTKRGYVRASDLKIGDEVILTRSNLPYSDSIEFEGIVSVSEYQKLKVGTVNKGGVMTEVVTPPRTISLDEKFGRLLGLYAAEGYTSKDATVVKWAFGVHEKDTLVPETVQLIKDVFGATARVQYRPNNVAIVCLGGRHFALLFDRLLGKGAEKKGLSRHLNGSLDFKRAMLFGWIDGDGHRRDGQIQGTTVSKNLALSMFGLANDLGYEPTIRLSMPKPNDYAKTRRPRWDVIFRESKVNPSINSNLHMREITSISIEEYIGYVYNLEVEGDHSFVADGIGSHNCVAFSWAQWANFSPVNDNWADDVAHTLYYEIKVIDGEPGQEDGSSVHSGAVAIKNRKRLSTYVWASTVDEIAQWVLAKGPVTVGTDWYDSMFGPDANFFVRPTGNIAGGHAYLIVGVDTLKRFFTCANSWGTSWGNNGYFNITMSDFQKLLSANGEACSALELPL